MIAFWSISALLVAGTLLLLLPPLLRRADTSAPLAVPKHAGTRHAKRLGPRRQRSAPQIAPEHARSGRIAAIAVGLGIPLASFLLYFQLGNPQGLTARKAEPTQTTRLSAGEQIETRTANMIAHLEQNPQDLKTWTMLARSFGAMGRYTDANIVYAKLVTLIPNSAQLLAEYAQTLAWANGKNLEGKPLELVGRALQLEPENRQALALAARAELDSGNHAGAIAHWKRLFSLLPADSESARSVAANLARAHELAGTDTSTASSPTSSAAPAKPQLVSGKSVSGVISLKKDLASRVSPGDAVFLYAHAPDARGMPLAAARLQVQDLPAKFSLDDSNAMTSGRKLSDFPAVSVVARISKTGDALPRSGDLQGAIPLVTLGAGGVTIVIDTILP